MAQLDCVISDPSSVEFDEILLEAILAVVNALMRHVSHHVTRAEHNLLTIRSSVLAGQGRQVAVQYD
jgi:hypothetical protein